MPRLLLITFEARMRNCVAWLALGPPVQKIVGVQPCE